MFDPAEVNLDLADLFNEDPNNAVSEDRISDGHHGWPRRGLRSPGCLSQGPRPEEAPPGEGENSPPRFGR